MTADHTGIQLNVGDRVLVPATIIDIGAPDANGCQTLALEPRLAGAPPNVQPPRILAFACDLLADVPRPAWVEGQPATKDSATLIGLELAENERQKQVLEDKAMRSHLAAFVEHLRKSPLKSAERTLALRALQQARHWLGEDLALLAEPYPYPDGNNPHTLKIDPPADVAPRRELPVIPATGAPITSEQVAVEESQTPASHV